MPADGGKAEAVTTLDTSRGEFSHRWPEILPDGKSVVFTVGTQGSWDDAVIAIQTIGASDRRPIVQGGTSPHFSRPVICYIHGPVSFMPLPFEAGGSAALPKQSAVSGGSSSQAMVLRSSASRMAEVSFTFRRQAATTRKRSYGSIVRATCNLLRAAARFWGSSSVLR